MDIISNPLDHPALALHRHLIELQARGASLPVELVAAIVLVESSGNTFAWRPEPYYRWLWDVSHNAPFRAASQDVVKKVPPDDFCSEYGTASAEWLGQQASWGLMQVMGAVARELGLDPQAPLTQLCDPQIGLAFGCAHLANLQRRFKAKHGWVGVAAAFNAGSVRFDTNGALVNRAYVAKLSRFVDLEALQ